MTKPPTETALGRWLCHIGYIQLSFLGKPGTLVASWSE